MVHWELRELVFSSLSRAVKLTEAGVLDEPNPAWELHRACCAYLRSNLTTRSLRRGPDLR